MSRALSVTLACAIVFTSHAAAAVPTRREGFVGSFPRGSNPAVKFNRGAHLLESMRVKMPQVSMPQLKMPKLSMPKPSVQGLSNLIAGGLAGAVAAAITCPLEVIKTNLQSSASAGLALSPWGMGCKIVREKGLGGLYRGLSATMVGIVPMRSCYFWVYSASKTALLPIIGDGPAMHVASAIAAGGVSNTLTCPLWMVKTRMQLGGGSIVQTTRDIIASNGVKGLYRGLFASYWGLTESALQLLLYEQMKGALNRQQPEGKRLENWKCLGVAGLSKGLASVLTYPHEVVRTRMRECGGQKYQGMIQSIRLIAKEEGRKGLYSGLGPHLMRVVPNTAIMFMSFELLSHCLPKLMEDGAIEQLMQRIRSGKIPPPPTLINQAT